MLNSSSNYMKNREYQPDDIPSWRPDPDFQKEFEKMMEAQRLGLYPYGGTDHLTELHTAKDIFQPLSPTAWIIEGLIKESSLNIFFGDGGTFKTWSLLDMLVSIATGGRDSNGTWLGFQVNPNPVLFIDEESGFERLQRRLRLVANGHKATENDPIYFFALPQFDFQTPEAFTKLENIVRSYRIKAVVIDALADVIPGADENSVKDIQPVIRNFRYFVDNTKAATTLIHHTNKNGIYRGSSALKGGVDLMVSVQKNEDDPYIKFKSVKERDIEPVSFCGKAEFTENTFRLSKYFSGKETRLNPTNRKIILALYKDGSSPINHITHVAQLEHLSNIRQNIKSLMKETLIERENPKFEKCAKYILTEKGENVAKQLMEDESTE
jgi:hypothetical protein